MNKQEFEKLKKEANRLAERDSVKQANIIHEANTYHNGYTQGLHDLLKSIEMEK